MTTLEQFCAAMQRSADAFIERFDMALNRYAKLHPPPEHDACVRLGGEHEWEPQPEFSGQRMTRYKCKHCEAWGYRIWRPARTGPVPPIRQYRNGFDTEAYRKRVHGSEEDRVEAMRRRDREEMP